VPLFFPVTVLSYADQPTSADCSLWNARLICNPLYQSETFDSDSPPTTAAANNAPLSASVTPNSLPQRASDVAARLQNLRNLLNNERHSNTVQRRAMDALDREMQEMSAAEPISARLDRRRRGLESQMRDYESHSLEASAEAIHSPSSLMRARRRATGPSVRLQRHRDRLNQTAMAREESEPSRAPVSYPPVPRIGSPDVATREYLGEAQVNRENRWRAKRRKLDVDDNNRSTPAFRYGHKGQVVPGKLKMQIVSCDGGQYTEPNGDSSWANNVLDDDSTVYCTKGNRCNMVLGHLGNMPFSLSKIVIKAPRTGFDAPIQEGMIFVSMDDDNLLARTANYQIQYTPRKHQHRYRRPEHGQIRLGPTHEYFSSVRSPLRSLARTVVDPTYLQASSSSTNSNITPMTADFHPQVDTSDAPPLVPGFRVTMNFDDNSDDEGHPPLQHGPGSSGDQEYDQADIERLLALQDHYAPIYLHTSDENEHGESSDSDSSDDEQLLEMLHSRDANYHRLSAVEQRAANEAYIREFREWRRERRRDGGDWWSEAGREPIRNRRTAPSHIQVAPPLINNSSPLNLAVAAAGRTSGDSTSSSAPASEILAPHARFFIRRDKSSVSVKFDPPMFVLLSSSVCSLANSKNQIWQIHSNQIMGSLPECKHRHPEHYCTRIRRPEILPCNRVSLIHWHMTKVYESNDIGLGTLR
jgi:hypothetical protein